ncbi:MAG: hypothetical protein GF333_00475 [Candidatus Omnitrophica bacterium]|nr:hypothetical protein [Candidatus Omnitrophota bacterium]
MSCEEIKKIIPSYIQHVATEEETTQVEEHLCVCHECRAHLSSMMERNSPPQKGGNDASAAKPDRTSLFDVLVVGIAVAVLLVFVFLLIKG